MTAECPFPGIPEYLNKEPVETLVIPGAQVTHICCVGDGGFTAELEGCSLTVARDAKVPAIYAEYLGGGGCSAKGVQAYFEGCLNVMAEIGMMDPRPAPTGRKWLQKIRVPIRAICKSVSQARSTAILNPQSLLDKPSSMARFWGTSSNR